MTRMRPSGRGDQLRRFVQFGACELQTRGTDASAAHPDLFLDEFDELNKFGDSIETKQRQKPAVEAKGLPVSPMEREIEELHRLFWIGVYQTRNPSDSSGLNGFHEGVVHAAKYPQTAASHGTKSRNPTNISARFLDGMQVRMFAQQFADVCGQKVHPVGNGIVVKHA